MSEPIALCVPGMTLNSTIFPDLGMPTVDVDFNRLVVGPNGNPPAHVVHGMDVYVDLLDKRLGESAYIAGPDYTIADMSIFPWVRRPWNQGVEADDYPNYQRWFAEILARPAVERALEVLADRHRKGPITDKEREVMFGATQYQRH